MALPTTGLTGHWDASTNTSLYKIFSAGTLQNNPADGENFAFWKNLRDATDDANTLVLGLDGTSPDVTWHNDAVLTLPSVRINNGRMATEHSSGVGNGFATYFNVASSAILCSFLIDSAGTYPNSTTPYFNCTLIGEARNQYFTVHVRKNGSAWNLYAYNWDGNSDTVEYPITPDVPHVLCMRHIGGTLYLSVDCGAELSISSGDTTNATAQFYLGDQGTVSGTVAEFRGRFGEVAFYNNLGLTTQGEVDDALAYFCNKWLATPQILGSAVFGVNTTVEVTRAIAFGLDGVTNVHNDVGMFKVFGDFEVTGTSTIPGFGPPAGTGVVRVVAGAYGTSGDVDLTTEVTGDLPFANLTPASAASKLLGRGSASGAGDYEEITVGSGLTMTATTLSAAGGASGLHVLGITIDGGGSVITTGVKGFTPPVPFSGTITKATVLSTDAAVTSGSIVVDVWKVAYASFPPTNSDSITASAPPTVTTDIKSEDATLTGWGTTVTSGDIFGFNVDSVSSFTRVVVALEVQE